MKVLLFLIFLFSHAIYFTYNIWVAKHAGSQSLFGIHFSSYWTYTLGAMLIATPILSIANYFFALGFYLGHSSLGAIWLVILFFLLAQICNMLLIPFLLLGELPSYRVALGAGLAIVGLYIAMTAPGAEA